MYFKASDFFLISKNTTIKYFLSQHKSDSRFISTYDTLSLNLKTICVNSTIVYKKNLSLLAISTTKSWLSYFTC